MKKRMWAMILAAALCLTFAPMASAFGPSWIDGQTFGDVPESHWAFYDVEAVARDGLMLGTGEGLFSPDTKVTTAQFLTLIGRIVFPDTVVGEDEPWYGPYARACEDAGLLAGARADLSRINAEITRYDMAVILRAAAKELGAAEKLAEPSQIGDYADILPEYRDAVRAVYGLGLIWGDGAGNFNGSNTMMRCEVAAVVRRLNTEKFHVSFEYTGDGEYIPHFCRICGEYMNFRGEIDGLCEDCYESFTESM